MRTSPQILIVLKDLELKRFKSFKIQCKCWAYMWTFLLMTSLTFRISNVKKMELTLIARQYSKHTSYLIQLGMSKREGTRTLSNKSHASNICIKTLILEWNTIPNKQWASNPKPYLAISLGDLTKNCIYLGGEGGGVQPISTSSLYQMVNLSTFSY